jgi:hypothetical protein
MSDNDNWLENLEHECDYFDKIPKNVKITFIYLTKGNNIKHIKKEKILLNDDAILPKIELIKLLNVEKNRIVGLLKCDTNILIDHIKENNIQYNLCKDVKSVTDQKWGKTANFLESLNDLVILIKSRENKETKKVKTAHNKTKKVVE